jgi:uncharacterized protein
MKSTRRFVFVLLLLLAAAFPALSETVASMPAPTGYVDDYAHVLSSPAKSELEATARELHDKTRAQVFLVTINTLEGEPVETFANELFAKWKIGDKKTDRGVLMLFAIKDRKRWIEIGYGLEGILNDAKVGDIGRDMVPALRAQNYDEAVKLGFNKICTIIAIDSGIILDSLANPDQPKEQSPLQQPAETKSASRSSPVDVWGFLFPLLWFGIIFFVIIRAIVSRRRRGISLGGYIGGIGGSTWSDSGSSFGSSNSSSDDSFSGGDGGSSGGGGAGGDW